MNRFTPHSIDDILGSPEEKSNLVTSFIGKTDSPLNLSISRGDFVHYKQFLF